MANSNTQNPILPYANIFKSQTTTSDFFFTSQNADVHKLEAMSYFFYGSISQADKSKDGEPPLVLKVDYELSNGTGFISFLYENLEFNDKMLKERLSQPTRFRSAALKFGKEVLIFCKCSEYKRIGFVSLGFQYHIKGQEICVPVLTWENSLKEESENGTLSKESAESLAIILEFSIFKTIDSIEALFEKEKTSNIWTKTIVYTFNGKIDEFENSCNDFISPSNQEVGVVHPFSHVNTLRSYLSSFFFKNPYANIFVCLRPLNISIGNSETSFSYKPGIKNSELDVKYGNSHTLKVLRCDVVFGYFHNELCYIEPLEGTESNNWIAINCADGDFDKSSFIDYLTEQKINMKWIRELLDAQPTKHPAPSIKTRTTQPLFRTSFSDGVEIHTILSDSENNSNEMEVENEIDEDGMDEDQPTQKSVLSFPHHNNSKITSKTQNNIAIFHKDVIKDPGERWAVLLERSKQLDKLRSTALTLFIKISPENKEGFMQFEKEKMDSILKTLIEKSSQL